ncbi:MAG TPA: hypothetical protein VNJ07_04040, partial [Chitinophagales bacterium]|nr:hypothetical protein [Chitinophagales bacterium]
KDCDDGNPCTKDFCNPSTGDCVHRLISTCLLPSPVLPPPCPYNGTLEIIGGLPPGSMISIIAMLELRNPQTLPGSSEIMVDALLMTEMRGTGALMGFHRMLNMPGTGKLLPLAPLDPSMPMQTIPIEIIELQLHSTGDPDFNHLRITAGPNFGLPPTPGITTFTMLPNGTWYVESFFDVFYRVEFSGSPGSLLDGMQGVTQGPIGRFSLDTSPECDDGTPCTIDFCDGNGNCVHINIDCDDDDPCTVDFCDNARVCQHEPVPCFDGNPCTRDLCINGTCVFVFDCNINPALCCNDNNPCTDDFCETSPNGTFCRHVPKDCNDDNPCTIDFCDNLGECRHPPVSFPCCQTDDDCNDGDDCTDDVCTPNHVCAFPPVSCNDNDDCTADFCQDGCFHFPADCDDGDPCTTDDCIPISGVIGCIHAQKDCDDDDPCTEDFCDPATGECRHNFDCTLSTLCCDDDNPCTVDNCTAAGCVHAPLCDDGNPCTFDFCVVTPLGVTCSHAPISCDDGNPCTIDQCANGACFHTPKDCSDNDPCTNDFCNERGECKHKPLKCDDNNKCTDDRCVNGACIFTPRNCGDNNPCTIDFCVDGECKHVPVNCNDNDPCTVDRCVNGNCMHIPKNCADNNPCTVDFCVNGACKHERVVCNDNNPCTTDKCVDGTCVFTPKNCADNNPCTVDRCVNGQCVRTPLDCNDNDPCTIDRCHHGNCTHSPVICNDNDPCTQDGCVTGVGCFSIAIDCNDGNPCTDDRCHNGHCHNDPVDCDDHDKCTRDFCNANGECQNVFDCALDPKCCDDDDKCTLDFCDASGACQHIPDCSKDPKKCCDDGNPCTVDNCIPVICITFPCPSVCVHTPRNCDDNNPCTRDICVDGNCRYISVAPTVTAGDDMTVYTGYQPASCATVTATAAGGTPPYAFVWSNGMAGASITVCPAHTTDYCVTVTDANGCKASDCMRVCVRNIRCNNSTTDPRVYICHRSETGASFTTLCVSVNDVPTHLAHGDRLGPCGLNICGGGAAFKLSGEELGGANLAELRAYPNPFSDRLNIEFALAEDSRVKLEIFSVTGQKLAVLFEGDVKANELKKLEYSPVSASGGVIIYRLQTEHGAWYDKAVLVR